MPVIDLPKTSVCGLLHTAHTNEPITEQLTLLAGNCKIVTAALTLQQPPFTSLAHRKGSPSKFPIVLQGILVKRL